MSLDDCIGRGMDEGGMDRRRGEEAQRFFRERRDRYRDRYGEGEAERRAAADTRAKFKRSADHTARVRLLQAKAMARIERLMLSVKDRKGRLNPGYVLTLLIENMGFAPFSSVKQRMDAIKGDAYAGIADLTREMGKTFTGKFTRKAQAEEIVAELFKKGSSGNPAAEAYADSVRAQFDHLRRRRNAAGGDTQFRKDYGLPIAWDEHKLGKIGVEEFVQFMLPRVDPQRMFDPDTGLPIDPADLPEALAQAFRVLQSGGRADLVPTGRAPGTNRAYSRIDPRFIQIKDGASWGEVNARFGTRDGFSTIIGHIEDMSREIAEMEILGPNADATMTYAVDLAKAWQATQTDEAGKRTFGEKAALHLEGDAETAKTMLAILRGQHNRPGGAFFPDLLGSTRNYITSALLGSTSLIAVTGDTATQGLRRAFIGLRPSRTIGDIARHLVSSGNKLDAVRMGLGAESWTSQLQAVARFGFETSGSNASRLVADSVMRLSLLTQFTQAQKHSFGMEFMGFTGSQLGKAYADLPMPFIRTLRRYGLTEEYWQQLSAVKPYVKDGVPFLRADDIRASGIPKAEAVATRYLEMILTETQHAVPEATLRSRATWVGTSRPGTFGGEILRSVAMFKNFPLTILQAQLRSYIEHAVNRSTGFVWVGAFVVVSTLAAALSLQAKEIAKGRDPRPMNTPEFWLAAMMAGGGLTIAGDFLFSNLNRHGQDIPGMLLGPIAGIAEDTRELTIGNAFELAQGKDTHAAAEAIRFVQRYMPGGSLWYARLALERLVFDQLQLLADPKAYSKLAQRERKQKREFGNDTWWRGGQLAPDRAPDLGAALP